MNKVFLGLGSNIGNRLENITAVIREFKGNNILAEINYSSIYETKPYGKIEQDNFLNCVVSFVTNLSVIALFKYVKNLERKIGRQEREVWGPREIDIDILLFGDLIFEDKRISIPHKDLLNRDFVLVPLLELDEDIIHPVSKRSIKEYLELLDERFILSKFSVKKIKYPQG